MHAGVLREMKLASQFPIFLITSLIVYFNLSFKISLLYILILCISRIYLANLVVK